MRAMLPASAPASLASPVPAASRRIALVACLCAVALAGCGGEKTVEITDKREDMPRDRTAPPGATTADRLGFRATAEETPRGDLAYDVPAGWEPLPPKPMRKAGFRLGGDPQTECTLITLPQAGGGMLANVNRWRKQMSLEPIDEAALAALPKDTLLGRPALLVDLEGRYVGMGGEADVSGAKLVGMLTELPAVSVFVKMVGNGKIVDAEREHFLAFARSVRMAAAGAGHAAGGPPPVGPSAGPSSGPDRPAAPGTGAGPASVPVRFTVPEGFEQRPDRSMRLATIAPKGATDLEIVLSSFPGDVGGLVANVNRWRDQMGLDRVEAAAVAALPRRKMLGGEAVLVDLTGHYTDMQGKTVEGAKLVGLVFERAEDTLFVKMTGPGPAVEAARAGFDAFVASLAPEAPK